MEIELGKCPFCKSVGYDESLSEIVNDYDTPYCVMACYCSKCEKSFTEYFGIDEVKFDDNDSECIYSNSLSEEEKEVIKGLVEEKMKNLNIEEYRLKLERILKVMSGGLNNEN